MTAFTDPLAFDGPVTLTLVEQADHADPLSLLRERFSLPADVIYLDGNSLGALPRGVAEQVQRAVVQQWGEGLIRSWNDAGWYPAPGRVGARIAPLIGAQPDEVIVTDSTSLNLYKLVCAALALRPQRHRVLCEQGDFPTSLYMTRSAARQAQAEVMALNPEDVLDAIDEQVAVVVLTHVNYRTGRRHDLPAMTRRAHDMGALVLWDLCHSAGAMPCDLGAHEVDFAVGCGYKFLNGGPGAPAFAMVARRHQAGLSQPLTGWFSHAQPFAFEDEYQPAEGIARLLVGTPPVLSLLALESALQAFDEVDLQALRRKSLSLTGLFMRLIDQELGGMGFEVLTPREADSRGSQVSIAHPLAYPIMQALIARGVIGDVREPNILRFGFAPMYIRHLDVWRAVAHLKSIVQSGVHHDPIYHQRKAVT